MIPSKGKYRRNICESKITTFKAQASLEFLTTYAWAFLVIIITIGALYYFGIFNFSKFLPQECIFTSQFECVDFSFTGDQIRTKILNNIGEKLTITNFAVTNDAINSLSCSLPATPIDWEEGTELELIFTNCLGGAFIPKERTEAKITIEYFADATISQPRHRITGKINAVVNEP